MRKSLSIVAALGALAGVAACDDFGQAMTSHTDVLARAAGHELPVDQAAGLLVSNPAVPAQAEVVDAVANLWVDYTLFAHAAAQDSTLASVDLDPLIRPFLEQEMVWKLRDSVIVVDSIIPDSTLMREFQLRQPNAQVRARHIMLRLPNGATQAQRDSVLAFARQLREQAAGGADFAALARQYSQEPSSAPNGGDTGFFGRNQMIGPFEEAAFALSPGQISDIVETPYGLHIIKLEERQLPDFESVRAAFTEELVRERLGGAEEEYITNLTDSLNLAIEDGAIGVAKDLAQKPGTELNRRARTRSLVSYDGGGFTAGEFLAMIQTLQPNQRGRLASAPDEEIENLLRFYARNEILVAEAEKHNLMPRPGQEDSLRAVALSQLRTAAGAAGLLDIVPQEGETPEQAIDRKVLAFLQSILRGEQSVLTLGPISYALRAEYGAEIYERAVQPVIERVQATRPQPQAPPGMPQPQPRPPAPPTDTTAGTPQN